MGSLLLQNTTTREVFSFYLPRFANETEISTLRLSPGSYRVLQSTIRQPILYEFLGLFQVETSEGNIAFVNRLSLPSLTPFNMIRPNWMIVSYSPTVTLREIPLP